MNATRKYYFSLFICTIAIVIMPVAVASGEATPNTGWFVAAQAGASWVSGSSSMPINNGFGTSADTYSIDSLPTAANVSAEAGYRWERQAAYLPYISLNIHYMHVFSSSLSGMVDEYSLPDYKNYNYQMDLSANNLHTLLKLDLYRFQRVMPYIEGGIGIGINSLSNYQEQPIVGIFPRVTPNFNNNRQVNFSYAVGGGLDFILSPHWWLTLGYQYINQGSTTSGVRTDGLASNTLHLDNIQKQVVFGGISYQFLS